MQIEIIYIARFGMIFLELFLENINDRRSNFVEKDNHKPYKIFL